MPHSYHKIHRNLRFKGKMVRWELLTLTFFKPRDARAIKELGNPAHDTISHWVIHKLRFQIMTMWVLILWLFLPTAKNHHSKSGFKKDVFS